MRNIPQRTIARLHQFIVHDRRQLALFPITFVYGFLRFHLRNQGLVAWLVAFVHSQTRRLETMTTLHLSDDIKINNALHRESHETWGCRARYRTLSVNLILLIVVSKQVSA